MIRCGGREYRCNRRIRLAAPSDPGPRTVTKTAKSILNELCQKRGLTPTYRVRATPPASTMSRTCCRPRWRRGRDRRLEMPKEYAGGAGLGRRDFARRAARRLGGVISPSCRKRRHRWPTARSAQVAVLRALAWRATGRCPRSRAGRGRRRRRRRPRRATSPGAGAKGAGATAREAEEAACAAAVAQTAPRRGRSSPTRAARCGNCARSR